MIAVCCERFLLVEVLPLLVLLSAASLFLRRSNALQMPYTIIAVMNTSMSGPTRRKMVPTGISSNLEGEKVRTRNHCHARRYCKTCHLCRCKFFRLTNFYTFTFR